MRRVQLWVVCLLVVPLHALAELRLSIEANPDPARPDEVIDVRLSVTNDGGVAETDVLLEMEIPPNTGGGLFNGTITGGGICPPTVSNNARCDVGEIATWDLGTIAAGAGVTVSIAPTVAAGTPDGTLMEFEGVVSDLGGVRTSLTRSVEVRATPAFELAVADDRDPASPGDLLTYTLRFGHVAAARVAPGTTLTLDLPADVTFVSADQGGVHAAGTVTWDLGTLLPGVAGEREVTVAVNAGVIDGTLMEASANVIDAAAVPESADARVTTRVDTGSPLDLALIARPDPVRTGESFEVEATVSNRGFFPLAGVVLEIRFPQNLQANAFNALLSNGGSCPAAVSNNGRCDARELATWDLGTIAAGSGVTVTLPPIVAAAVIDGTLISFDAAVSDAGGAQSTQQATLHVDSDHALELALEEDADPTDGGEELTYSLRYGHASGVRIAPGTVLRFEVPEGTAFVSATDGGTLSNGAVEWNLGTVFPDEASERRVTVAVDAGALDGDVVEAQASIADTDAPAEEAFARAVTRVEGGIPLELAVTARPDPVRPGETLEVEATVTNNGFLPAAGVVLEIRTPDGLGTIFNAMLSSDGLCPAGFSNNGRCDAREFATWDLGTIPAGGGRTLSLPAIAASAIANATLISFPADVRDGSGVQRTLQRTVHVESAPALELSLSESLDPVEAGEELTYTLRYGHVSATRFAPGTTLRLELPEGVSFVSASDGGVLVGGGVEWALGSLDPGGSGERRATVEVDAGLSDGTLLEARALLVDTDAPAQRARGRAQTRVQADVPLDLAIAVERDPAGPDDPFEIALTVTNSSPFAAAGVVLELLTPQGLNAPFDADLSDGGDCVPSFSNNGRCDARERATWNLGTLSAGEEVTVTMQASYSDTGDLEGETIDFQVEVADGGDAQRTLGRSTTLDNCPFIQNTDQANSDVTPRGDACSCGDQTGDGTINVGDILAINAAIFDPPLATPLCDANNDGLCNVSDILAVNADIFSPNESTICAEQPCPDLDTVCAP